MEDILPFHAKRDATIPEHILENLIYSFNLSLSLRMIGCAEQEFGTHGFLKAFPEMGSEDTSRSELISSGIP